MDIFFNHSKSHLNSISRQLDELHFSLEIENENLKMSKGRLEGRQAMSENKDWKIRINLKIFQV